MRDDQLHPRLLLNRRQALTLLVGTAAAAAVRPRLLATVRAATRPEYYGFLDAEEIAILDAATARLLPTDHRPGAREVGIVDYIQSFLTFMPGADANCDERVNAADITAIEARIGGHAAGCPNGGDVDGDSNVDESDVIAAAAAVFRARPVIAAGPFSGRNPQPHFPIGMTACQECHGATNGLVAPAPRAASTYVYPPNAFQLFLPLNRLQRLSWRIRLLGADSVPEVADNPLARDGLEVDLRRTYRRGLAAIESASQEMYQTGFVDLPGEQQAAVLSSADPDFYQVLLRHVIDGTLCAPEYGGNRDRLGWQLAGFDGDSQPLGYEIYDTSVPGNYRERPDKPNSGPNPDERCAPFSDGVTQLLSLLARVAQPGAHFADPYCFEHE